MTTTEALIAAHEGKLKSTTDALRFRAADLAANLDDLVIRLGEPTGEGTLSVNPSGVVQSKGQHIDLLCVQIAEQVEILEELRRLENS